MRWRKEKLSAEVSWLVKQLRPLLPLSIANLICIVVSSALTLLAPLIIKWLIDVAILQRSLRLVLAAAAAFGVTYLASMGMSYVATYMSAVVAQKMVFRIRISLLRRLHALPSHYQSKPRWGTHSTASNRTWTASRS